MDAFHSQQAVEKSLKSLLEFNKCDIPKIHSLNRLFKLCENDFMERDLEIINTLDSLYIESRYPGDLGLLPYGKPTVADAAKLFKFAKTVFQIVHSLIKVK